jgi:hypothetical protein
MLDPLGMLTNTQTQYVYGEGISENGILKCVLIQLSIINKDRHAAKSIIKKKY